MSIYECSTYKELEKQSERATRELSQEIALQSSMPWGGKRAMKRRRDELKQRAKMASDQTSNHLENCPVCRDKG